MTAATATRPGARHVEHCMGTVFAIDIRDPGDWEQAVGDVVSWLHHVDRVFSTYRPDSDISRLQRGELTVTAADPAVALVLDQCAALQAATNGWFTAQPTGRMDPTGLVKGWAVEQASDLLRSYGSDNHAVSGGGDMQLAGEAAPKQPWRLAISDPFDGRSALAVVAGRDLAIATSGSSERGDHIIDPFNGRPATALASATVVTDRLTVADALATAACAMGTTASAWLETAAIRGALVVTADGVPHPTSTWSRLTSQAGLPAGRVESGQPCPAFAASRSAPSR